MGIQVGDMFAGKYRVDHILGEGGMGYVVAATHLQLEEKVAIKFLHAEILQNREAVERFAREARAAVRIKSEHVARVSDVGTLEDGSPYMVMEYLQGEDLAAAVQRIGPLPVNDAVAYVLQACEAIAEAHSLGIVHRDLKPANLFLTHRADGSPSVKVLDFGISKSSSGSNMSMTQTTTVMGSPLYMSPEQMASSRNVDQRADIWSLGIILHELLSGSVPFAAETLPQLCAKVLTEPPAPLRTVRPDAPAALEAVVTRCLERDTTRRFQTVAELAVSLAEFAGSEGRTSIKRITATLGRADLGVSALQGLGASPTDPAPAPPKSLAPGGSTALDLSSTGTGAKPRGGARTAAIAAGAVALLAVIGVGAFVSRGRGASQPPPPIADSATATPPAVVAPAATPAATAVATAAPVIGLAPSASAAAATPTGDTGKAATKSGRSTPATPPAKTAAPATPATTPPASPPKPATPTGFPDFGDRK